MNAHNKQKFKEVREVDIDKKLFNHFIDTLSFKQKAKLILNVGFKTRRGILFLSGLAAGMAPSPAFNHSMENDMVMIIHSLDHYGWEINRSGKLT